MPWSFSTPPPHSCDFCKWSNAFFKELLSLFISDFLGIWWLFLIWCSTTRSEEIFWELSLGTPISALLAEKSYVFFCPFLCLLRHLFLFIKPIMLCILFAFGFVRLASSPDAYPPSSFSYPPDDFPPSLSIPETSFPWTIESARASSGGSVSMAYRTSRSGEGCGDWCVQKSVRAVCDIGWIASKNVEYAMRLHDRSSQTVANRLEFDAGLSHSTVVWGMWWFVHAMIGAWGLWYRASSVFELPIWINGCR